jgi:hypothetical protein
MDRSAMTNIQIAIDDGDYAQKIASLLGDGSHRAYIVNAPVVAMDGVILLDDGHFKELAPHEEPLYRYVILKRAETTDVSGLWKAGVRHVVFESDPIPLVHMAILAVELGLTTK